MKNTNKTILIAFMAMLASAVSAQVKVTSNGNVTMSKNLYVEGITKAKLANEKDVMARPTINAAEVTIEGETTIELGAELEINNK